MPLSMNHSPIAAPANGARYWLVAESDAGDATMMRVRHRPGLLEHGDDPRDRRLLLADRHVDASRAAGSSCRRPPSAALLSRAWLMIVSMQIVVLPVERSPMINSRWPRPIGIIASIGMMPVCTGWPIGPAADDAGRELLDRIGDVARDRPLPVQRLAERVDDASQQALADRDLQQLARRADLVALLELRVVAEDDDADFGLVQVQRQAGDAVAEVEHLVEHDIAEAFDLGDAVADLADDADGLLGQSRPWRQRFGLRFPAPGQPWLIASTSARPSSQTRASSAARRARTLSS